MAVLETRSAMTSYLAVAIVLGFALALIAALFLVARAVTVQREVRVVLPMQSGFGPREHALSRYHARWYPLTLVFLAFDVEMLFMYPWSVVAARLGAEAIIEMFVFLGVLFVGVLWAWREGAFRWV